MIIVLFIASHVVAISALCFLLFLSIALTNDGRS
jgi:hypothetical protein